MTLTRFFSNTAAGPGRRKRGWIAILTAMLATGIAARAGAESLSDYQVPRSDIDVFMDIETYRLWPGRAPQSTADDIRHTPTLTIFRPSIGKANGSAVIVAPGGGYVGLAGILEGRQVADWFTSRGITAFVLRYRVGADARLPVPLLDGARAVRFVRAHAASFRISPNRIGMIGFSAGGHLVATVAAEAGEAHPAATDPVERADAHVDFAVLAYPWLEGTTIDAGGHSQYCSFARTNCRPADYTRFRPVEHVTAAFPPTFIYHTTADGLVRPDGSLVFYQALVKHQVPVEMHIFAQGEHGTGFGGSDPVLSEWPALLDRWLRSRGLYQPAGGTEAVKKP